MKTPFTRLSGFRKIASFGAACLFATVSNGAIAQSGPQVSLVPSAVINELKITSESTREMDAGMVEIINRMTNQRDLYKASNCEGDASSSEGCNKIFSQINETYIEMLDSLATSLPKVKKSIELTETMLQKRIATELGAKRSAEDIQNELVKQGVSDQPYRNPRMSNRGIASTMEAMYQRISASNSGSQSIMSTASSIYLDLNAAAGWMVRLEARLVQARTIAQLNSAAGRITPEMDEVIAEVSAMVLGDNENPDTPYLSAPQDAPAYVDDRFTM